MSFKFFGNENLLAVTYICFTQCRHSGAVYARRKLKKYVFPEVKNEDCEQKYISGWGPGGSKVNSAQNAVMLRHKTTNCVVKVHDSRLLQDNIKIAFKRLRLAVDNKLNGENSYESQFKRLEREYEANRKRAKEKRRKTFEEIKA